MSMIIDSLRGVAGLFKYALRTFSLTLFAIECLYGPLLTAIVLWIVIAEDSLLRLILALSINVILVMLLGLFVSFQFTMSKTVSRFLERTAIGRRIFDALFDLVLGISDESPEGRFSAPQSMHGMSLSELEDKLNAAGDVLLSQKVVAATLPRLALWFAGKIQRTLVWATIRVIIRSCSSEGSNSSIDLLMLRQNLADVIDAKIADYLKLHATRLMISLFISVSLLAILLAYGIRQIPF
ncbi:hypothetical protein [Gimesia fumaroli]|uniref:Uncharacterized protein n=1 Tax=Gimesia fumaroli TaxID=2527976 RepID=A0A518IF85_9PLAN|nr:hypothetical protein [Gimesia fumaroli]QDV51718.1 hypothetical protein Enr17x_37760 [Gimesia fumaroli]